MTSSGGSKEKGVLSFSTMIFKPNTLSRAAKHVMIPKTVILPQGIHLELRNEFMGESKMA